MPPIASLVTGRPALPVAALLAATVAAHAAAQPLVERQDELAQMTLPADLQVPRVEVPLYVMEYHIWHKSPFGEEAPDGFVHWDLDEARAATAIGPDWMRDKAPVGYPLPGIYNSEDRGVIRWQLQCMRNAGVDGAFVQMFPNWNNGEVFDRVFIWDKILTIAGEEGFKVACHDEVMFRQGRPAQDPALMAKRLGAFVRDYGKHPAYLRIEGQPAVAFQFWNRFKNEMTIDELRGTLREAEVVAGEPIYWILHAAPSAELYALEEIDAFIPMANTNSMMKRVPGLAEPALDWPQMQEQFESIRRVKAKIPRPDIGLWVYPGFDESPRVLHDGREAIRWLPRRGGQALVEVLRRYVEQSPDFVMLTSWNDWQENTAVEPGLFYDGYAGDPYLYCRILAAAKGVRFVPPPLPPKESVDPWMLQPLYGIDRIPPQITQARYLPMRPGLVATATDSANPIARIVSAYRGDVLLDATDPQTPRYDGITAFTPARFSPRGMPIRRNQPLRITIDPAALDAEETTPVHLALEYTDSAKGRLHVTYPVTHELVNHKPGDENRYPVRATIPLHADGHHRAAVRLLRGFVVGAQPMEVEVQFEPASDETPDAALAVTRLHLFRGVRHAVEGQPIDHAAPDSQVRTVVLDTPNLKGPVPTAAYLFAWDAQGNRSAPHAAHAEGFHPIAVRP